DPSIVGRSLSLDGEAHTVVGILPAEFEPGLLPRGSERGLWTPYPLSEAERETRASAWWNVVGRLKPEVGLEQARSELASVAGSLARERPGTNAGVEVRILPFRDHLVGAIRPVLLLLLGAVAVLLVVTWANVAGLLLARGTERERELAIRVSLGAGRVRLVR